MYGIKGDRLDLKTYGTACSDRGWPYFKGSCPAQHRSPRPEACPVRVVGTDRAPALRTATNGR
jgi:hypothetical protein